MAGVDPAIVNAVLSHQVDLLRLSADVRARVFRHLGALQRELTRRLIDADVTAFNRARLQAFLRQVSQTIADYYVRAQGEAEIAMAGVAQAQAGHVGSLIVTTGANLPTETFFARLASRTLIHGAVSADWWARQAADTAFRFAGAVRQGVALGEPTDQIVTRIVGKPREGVPGIMDASRRNARSLVHSSVQAAANASRLETFRANRDVVKGVRQVSTFDSHTTEICAAYSGDEWDLDGNPINGTVLPFVNAGGSIDGVPRHWNCRSVLVPITKTFRELGIDVPEPKPGTRASTGGPIRATTTFEQWLSRRTKAQQDEQLGAGRADLWRAKKLTLEQLLDLRGNPLTLDQLRARYAS